MRIPKLPSLDVLLTVFAIATAQTAMAAPIIYDRYALDSVTPGEDGEFGESVAIFGNLAVVGADACWLGCEPQTPGYAFVYELTGTGWNRRATLSAPDSHNGNAFGSGVSLTPDIVMVGAQEQNGARGAAYIYRRMGDTWSFEQKLTASDGEIVDRFGWSVATEDDLAVVGAPCWDGAEVCVGATYVFRQVVGPDGGYVEEARLTPPDDQTAGLGRSVAISDGVIAAGAPWDRTAGEDAGAVYLFRHHDTQWIQEEKLLPSNPIAGAKFGESLDLAGDILVVGAAYNTDSECAYVFRRVQGAWVEEAILTPADAMPGDEFGASVTVDGDIIIVGAEEGPNEWHAHAGAAYLFRYDGVVWREEAKLVTFSEFSIDFGHAVALDDGMAIVSAVSTSNSEGAAYLYQALTDCNSNQTADVLDIVQGVGFDCNGNDTPDSCDVAAGTSWDLDGNGQPDECDGTCGNQADRLVANDFRISNGQGRAVAVDGLRLLFSGGGAAYVYEFVTTGWKQVAKLTSLNKNAALVGEDVALQGDLAVIGAPHDEGSALVYRKDGTEWLGEAHLQAGDPLPEDEFGHAVSLDENVIVVGAPANHVDDRPGAVYVYRYDDKNGGGWIEEGTRLIPRGAAKGDDVGWSVAANGNRFVTGDKAHNGQKGAAYVYRLIDGLWSEESKLTAFDGAEDDSFGRSVALNGLRIAVGAPLDDAPLPNSGSVYIFELNTVSGDWEQRAKLVSPDPVDGGLFGWSLALMDDSLLIGARNETPSIFESGGAYLFRYDGVEWQARERLESPIPQDNMEYGWSVAFDGLTAVVGANMEDNFGESNAGAVYVYHAMGDCNGNGAIDACDLRKGISTDDNADWIPDECQLAPAALTRVASLLMHAEGDPPKFHDLIAANGIEPRRGGPEAIYFEVAQDIDAATIDPESVNVTCLNQTSPAHTVGLFDTNVFTVEFADALADQDCCTIDYAGVRTVSGAPIAGPFNIRSLEGDMNFDGAVTGGDALLIKSHFGDEVDPFFPHWDFDRSGFITGGDYALIKPRFGNTAPACP